MNVTLSTNTMSRRLITRPREATASEQEMTPSALQCPNIHHPNHLGAVPAWPVKVLWQAVPPCAHPGMAEDTGDTRTLTTKSSAAHSVPNLNLRYNTTLRLTTFHTTVAPAIKTLLEATRVNAHSKLLSISAMPSLSLPFLNLLTHPSLPALPLLQLLLLLLDQLLPPHLFLGLQRRPRALLLKLLPPPPLSPPVSLRTSNKGRVLSTLRKTRMEAFKKLMCKTYHFDPPAVY